MIEECVRNVTPVPGGALLAIEDTLLEVRAVGENVVRVQLAPHGEFRAE